MFVIMIRCKINFDIIWYTVIFAANLYLSILVLISWTSFLWMLSFLLVIELVRYLGHTKSWFKEGGAVVFWTLCVTAFTREFQGSSLVWIMWSCEETVVKPLLPYYLTFHDVLEILEFCCGFWLFGFLRFSALFKLEQIFLLFQQNITFDSHHTKG